MKPYFEQMQPFGAELTKGQIKSAEENVERIQGVEKELQAEIEKRFAELRQLQEEEAAAIERQFEASLSLPLGKAAQLMDRADELANKYANTPRADKPPHQTDK